MDPTRELIERARDGEKDAFDELISRHRPRIRALVEARLGAHLRDVVEAEDVVQETVLKVLESIHRFSWQGEGSFMRWVGTIAEHIIRSAARKKERRPFLPLKTDVPDVEDPQWKALRRDERFDRFQKAFDSLDPASRKVIYLARIKGLPIRDVARELDRTSNATSILLYRALIKLKAAFGDTESLRLPLKSLEERGPVDDV